MTRMRICLATGMSLLALQTSHCLAAADDAQVSLELPEGVRLAAEAIVSGRTSVEFFSSYLTLDSTTSTYHPGVFTSDLNHPPYWSLVYRMRMPSKPWVQGIVEVHVDSTGTMVNSFARRATRPERRGMSVPDPDPERVPPPLFGLFGACDCANHPEECTFDVDENAAIETAKRAGFRVGLKPWEVKFQWVARVPVECYHWVITNTLTLQPDGCSGSGESIVIDSSTGEIIGKSGWGRICCGR